MLPDRAAVPAGVPVLRADDRGVLHGDGVFETLHVHGRRLGRRAGERMVAGAGLPDAAGVWLTSSARGLVEVRALDGVPVPPSPHTPRLRGLLDFRDDGNHEDLPLPRRGKSP